MYNKFKNHIYTDFFALIGFTLLLYIYKSIEAIYTAPLTMYGTKSLYGFWFITSFFFCPYMFLTILLALFLFLIEYTYKKIRKIKAKEKTNSDFYNVFFNIGFSLYLFFSTFFAMYVSFCIITDIFNLN